MPDFKKAQKSKGAGGTKGSASVKISFDSKKLEGALADLDDRAKRAMAGAAIRMAPDVEAWMKSNAKWTDRTSNARNGLSARPQVNGNAVDIVMAHGVPYGIWLEVRWGGRLSIIQPAIEHFGPQFTSMTSRLLDL